jgi:hypothetical protein
MVLVHNIVRVLGMRLVYPQALVRKRELELGMVLDIQLLLVLGMVVELGMDMDIVL